ncbi:MAG TPA: cytochrome P450 [Solirubrobacteraceae bacterium]|nr:cytochrome P450 [Solirubrobacteraceae bacterium]
MSTATPAPAPTPTSTEPPASVTPASVAGAASTHPAPSTSNLSPRQSRWDTLPRREVPALPADTTGAPPGPRIPRHILGPYWLLAEHDLLERCRRRFGEVFSLRMWPVGFVIVVADPAEIKRVFMGDPDQLRAGEGNAIMEQVAGPESVLLLDGGRHLNRRKLMLPPFHGERLAVYGELISEIADDEIDRWPLNVPFSAHSSMQAITLRVILRAVLGIDDDARRLELERLLPKLLNSPALLWPFLQYDLGARSPWRRFQALRERVDAMLFEEIARKREDPDLAQRPDILSMLLQARDEDGRAMSDEELRDQLITLLLAGHETTASGLAWLLERTLRTPAVHARLREAIAQDDERYVECAIKESLRVRPVVPLAARRVIEPFEVGDYTAPAGALLTCSMTLTHSDPRLYPEPEAFRPERFLEDAPDTYTWIPFGGGVRRCIGAAFATFEMKIIVQRVFARCALEAPDARPERPRRRFVTYPPNRGAQVKLTGRL